jgi:hypothetical protein
MLKDLEENIDANGQDTRAQLSDTAYGCLCYLHYGFESHMEAATSDVGQVPEPERLCTQISDPIKSSFRRRRTSGFLPSMGDFGLAMSLKVGVLVTTHWAESLAGSNAWRLAEWFVIKISSPSLFETESFS